jgi:DNA-binding NtrC family response regulator
MELFKKNKKSKILKILLVDDSQYIHVMLERIISKSLNNCEYKLDSFESYEDFKAESKDKKYDIAFTDWKLGSMDNSGGKQVINDIKKSCKNVAILSGFDEGYAPMAIFATKNNALFISKDDGLKEKIVSFLIMSAERLGLKIPVMS